MGQAPIVPLAGAEAPSVAVHAAVDPALLTRLANVPGLDVTRGVAALHGKAAKYVELLGRFAAVHAEDMTRLAEFLATGDQAAATRMAHSLKGAAGTLGIDRLAEIARRIEFALRDSPQADRETLNADMEAIHREFMALAAVLPAPTSAAPAPTTAPPPEFLRPILDVLESRLEEGDFTAAALFKEHAPALRAALGSRYDEIAAQFHQFDLKAALATLRGRSA